MTEQLAPAPVFKAWDNAGVPLNGGKLFTYIANSSTKQASFTDSTGGTPNTNPVILNFRGEANVWLDPTKVYKLVLAPANDTDPPTNPFWTVDQISGGSLSPTGSIIPTVDNLFTLGNTSFSWANVYVGPNHAPILGASGIVGYYPRTATEISLGITPTDFSYTSDPVDPRRYGAKGDWNGSTGTDDTVAWQTAINVAYAATGRIQAPAKFVSLVGALSLTMTTGKSLIISGQSPTGTLLHAKAGLSATSILTFTSGNPATTQIDAYLKLENFGIDGSASITVGVHGISLLGIGAFQISNVRIAKFDRALDFQSSLIGIIDSGTECVLNNTGLRIVAAGASTTANLIRVKDSRFNANAKVGIDFNGGSELQLRGVDIEGNGTPGDVTTGGLFIRGQIGPDALEASVIVDGCWFESNNGISLFMEANTLGASTVLSVRGGQILAADSGRALYVFGCSRLSVEDIQCASALDTFNLTATNAYLKNVLVSVLTDTGVTFPTYSSVSTATTQHINGRLDPSLAVTMTGCTTSPIAGTLDAVLQGNRVVLRFAAISGTSNATTCTIGTLPAKYRPAATRLIIVAVVNNGVDEVHGATVSTGGVIDLDVFSAAGTKGIRLCQGEYVL